MPAMRFKRKHQYLTDLWVLDLHVSRLPRKTEFILLHLRSSDFIFQKEMAKLSVELSFSQFAKGTLVIHISSLQ